MSELHNAEDVIRLVKERLPMLKVEHEVHPAGIDSHTIVVSLPTGRRYHITCEEMDDDAS